MFSVYLRAIMSMVGSSFKYTFHKISSFLNVCLIDILQYIHIYKCIYIYILQFVLFCINIAKHVTGYHFAMFVRRNISHCLFLVCTSHCFSLSIDANMFFVSCFMYVRPCLRIYIYIYRVSVCFPFIDALIYVYRVLFESLFCYVK